MNIFYQDKLINHIDTFTLGTLPHTILLFGDKGSGKHLIANYIVSKFNLDCVDITENLNLDTIMNIYLSSQLKFYMIDTDEISVKEQQVILKLLEEPNSNVFLLLLNSNNSLLETITSRCYKLKLGNYSKENLKTFLLGNEPEEVLNIARTPGQIKTLIENNLNEMIEFSNKIFMYISTANFSNVLTISNNISFTKKDKGYPIDVFILVLLYSSKTSYEVYNLTNNLYNMMCIQNVNKRYLFYNYLIDLKSLNNEKFRKLKEGY